MIIERAVPEAYRTVLTEYSRPPSRGGNTNARHSHILVIEGRGYSFVAAGQRKWVFKGDTVSFEWEWDPTERYRNIVPGTMKVWDKKGDPVVRGDYYAKQLRVAPARLPAPRREQRD